MDVLVTVGLLCFLGTLLAVQNGGQLVARPNRHWSFIAIEHAGLHALAVVGGMTSTLICFLLMV